MSDRGQKTTFLKRFLFIIFVFIVLESNQTITTLDLFLLISFVSLFLIKYKFSSKRRKDPNKNLGFSDKKEEKLIYKNQTRLKTKKYEEYFSKKKTHDILSRSGLIQNNPITGKWIFKNIIFEKKDFKNTDLSNSLFKNCNFIEMDICLCNLKSANFNGSYISETKFTGSNMQYTDFSESNIIFSVLGLLSRICG